MIYFILGLAIGLLLGLIFFGFYNKKDVAGTLHVVKVEDSKKVNLCLELKDEADIVFRTRAYAVLKISRK
jgi:hypothetical protein